MMRKIELVDYEVDEAMLGSQWNEDSTDDLTDFCEVLQELCNERCIFVNIVEITDSVNGATHRYYRRDTGEELYYVFETLSIPWGDALEKYCENKLSDEEDEEIEGFECERCGCGGARPRDFTTRHRYLCDECNFKIGEKKGLVPEPGNLQ